MLLCQLITSPLFLLNKHAYNLYTVWAKGMVVLARIALTEYVCPCLIRVSGDVSVQGQIQLMSDGRLKTDFPERLVLIANHQTTLDGSFVWWSAYTNGVHGHIIVILKDSLKSIPILGLAMKLYGFIFLARKWEVDKSRLESGLKRLIAHSHLRPNPMWLIIFPEGTVLTPSSKNRSDNYARRIGFRPLRNVLLPRSTGLFYCLKRLKSQAVLEWVYDCTLGYERSVKSPVTRIMLTKPALSRNDSFPGLYYTFWSVFIQRRQPKEVNMHWRRYNMAEIPLGSQSEFEVWLRARWVEKDELLDRFYRTGRFATERTVSTSADDKPQTVKASMGYVETHARLSYAEKVKQTFIVWLGYLVVTQLAAIGVSAAKEAAM
ncbi:acyltransferase [Aspergillus udagawae]|nr:acyltransferase [Aspergillus udagawae]